MNILSVEPDKLFSGEYHHVMYEYIASIQNARGIAHIIKTIDCGRTSCDVCAEMINETDACPNCGNKVLAYASGLVECGLCRSVLNMCYATHRCLICTAIAIPIDKPVTEDTV